MGDNQGEASGEEKAYEESSAAAVTDLPTQKVFRAVQLKPMFSLKL